MSLTDFLSMMPVVPRPEKLLELSDSVRRSLSVHKSLGPDADQLNASLQFMLEDEDTKDPGRMLKHSVMMHARLDKLLQELLEPLNMPDPLAPRHARAIKIARVLRQKWERRLGERYFNMDGARLDALAKTGPLWGCDAL